MLMQGMLTNSEQDQIAERLVIKHGGIKDNSTKELK